MVSTRLAALTVVLASLSLTSAFDESCNSNLVTYWGQNTMGILNPTDKSKWEKPLRDYCNDNTLDVINIGFMNVFNGDAGNLPQINLSCHCGGTHFPGTTLLSCPDVGEDIKYCQSKGKKVTMSLGGAAGSYGLDNDADGERFAKTVWDTLLGGSSNTRPFGSTILDGIDLDIEAGVSTGYGAFIRKLRTYFDTDKSRKYITSAAPQCPYPDMFLGNALDEAWFDMVYIQFYNNYCTPSIPGHFNYGIWDHWAKTKSVNPDVKLFIGTLGNPKAGSYGYMTPDELKPLIDSTRQQYSSFGGVMTWEASTSESSMINGVSFAQSVKNILMEGGKCSGHPQPSKPASTHHTTHTAETHKSSIHHTTETHNKPSTHHTSESHKSSHHTTETHKSSAHHTTETHKSSTHHTTETHKPTTHHTTESHNSSHHTTETHKSSAHHTTEAHKSSTHHTTETHKPTTHHTTESHKSSHHTTETHKSSAHHTTETRKSSTHHTTESHKSSHHTTETPKSSAHHTTEAHKSSTDHTTETHKPSHHTTETHKSSAHHTTEAHKSSTHHTTETHKPSHHTTETHKSSAHHTTETHKPSHHTTESHKSSAHHTSETHETHKPSTTESHAPKPTGVCPVQNAPCNTVNLACNGNEYAQCVFGKWVLRKCDAHDLLTCVQDNALVYCDWAYKHPHQPACTTPYGGMKKRAIEGPSNHALIDYAAPEYSNNMFKTTVRIRTTTTAFSNNWRIQFELPRGQTIVNNTRGVFSQKGNKVTVISVPKKEPDWNMAILFDIMGTHKNGSDIVPIGAKFWDLGEI
ncbi:glycoside hydrolase [Basidiobolus meristosporus CBS 931.73]|uniref:chitinase n=1 Tax=Basidiobolus meristosporus CBS 931.73 TaxID=1314790 RepID=A0A1Y1XLU7_9FUNG|nr:glycoside hydrolase [Basidiobolus meristosporus CBS 931.73]|eukprot:ORX86717.1 glycoside hydrolase [Basidiobolus meristosporus CBS 931.73]